MPAPALSDGEKWMPIPGYEAYSVSTHGRVKRVAITHGGGGSIRHPSGCLKQVTGKSGHRRVTLSIGNQTKTLLVHRLVAIAFLGMAAPGKALVCHKDDDPQNNHLSNLYWGDHRDNAGDLARLGRQRRGETAPVVKLSEQDVRDIRARALAGDRQRDIAKVYGVSQSNVSMIVAGKTWGHTWVAR